MAIELPYPSGLTHKRRSLGGYDSTSSEAPDEDAQRGPARKRKAGARAARTSAVLAALRAAAEERALEPYAWQDWLYFPGNTASPLYLLSPDLATTEGSRMGAGAGAGQDSRTTTRWVFYALRPVKRVEGGWALVIVILEAAKGDPRMKGMRRHLYPGLAVHLPSHLYTVHPVVIHPQADELVHVVQDSDDDLAYPASTLAPPTPARRTNQLLVADLQRPPTPRSFGAEDGVTMARMAFQTPARSYSIRQRSGDEVEWGSWIEEGVAKDFKAEVRTLVDALYADFAGLDG